MDFSQYGKSESEIDKIIDEVQQEFGIVLARNFPEVTTGDFPPDAQLEFDNACRKAVGTWLMMNHPQN